MSDPVAASASPGARDRLEPAAIFLLVLLSAVWAWWAWQEGAYFGVVLLPGLIVLCLGTAVAARFATWPISFSSCRPVAAALIALAALGLWSVLSATWSPTPDVAVGDGQRILAYALAFGLSLWLATMLRARVELTMVPFAAAAAIVGILTIIALAGDSPRTVLEGDGTLDYPLGYRNANAAFFAIAIFPAVGLAANHKLKWWARAPALAIATLCIDLVGLSQSRASMVAMIPAVAVYVLLSPVRLRALAWLVLAALPAAGIIGAAADLYRTAGDNGVATVTAEMNAAGLAVALTVAGAFLLGALAALIEGRMPAPRSAEPRGNRAIAASFALLAAVGALVFIIVVGNPVEWAGDRYDEFKSKQTPDLSGQTSRFTFNAGSNRYDLWRVALDDFDEDPVRGDGGGGFQDSYLLKRADSTEVVRDAHSVELELLSELGLPGLALFVVAIVGIALGILRARRRSPPAAALGAVAFASGTYWLIHTSVDWFWFYPAIAAPVLGLLGSACGPAVTAAGPPSGRSPRRWLTAGAIVLALSAVPPFLSERYVNDAYAGWREDLARAYDDLAHARDLNPLSDRPLLAEAAIARAAGDEERAIAVFGEAARKRPESWATHYLLAELQQRRNPRAARREIETALELNPLGEEVRGLAKRLGVSTEPTGG